MNPLAEAPDNTHTPDFIFEVSWEVCNKVGGIYTVITTKYNALASAWENNDQLIFIGPDVWKETTGHPDFDEDVQLMKNWREYAASEGLYFRIGRWKIAGRPLAILVDFTAFFTSKDEIFARFWEEYGLDSISGQWDYIEPAMFGYAAGRVIESFYRSNLSSRDKVLAQFHEWMTGTGVLYLKEKTPGIALAFTTHATVLGRSMAGNGRALYSAMDSVNPDALATEFRVKSKHSLEKLAARNCDIFTTVSGITSRECIRMLGKEPDLITPNGFDDALIPVADAMTAARQRSRERILKVAENLFSAGFDESTLLVLNSGRYEFRNKGIDLFIEAVGDLARKYEGNRKIIAIIAVPAYHKGPRHDLIARLNGETPPLNEAHHALTHLLHDPSFDPVLEYVNKQNLSNHQDGKIFICFVPTYLNGKDGIFGLNYYEFLSGFDLTVFPSYYEPWGYTPLESIAFGIPTLTTSLAGFGSWVKDDIGYDGYAARVIARDDFNDAEVVSGIESYIVEASEQTEDAFAQWKAEARKLAAQANWMIFIKHYLQGYRQAVAAASERGIHDPYYLSNGRKQRVKPEREVPQWSKVLVNAAYPAGLEKLRILAGNLWWSWNTDAIDLFSGIRPEWWETSGNNPIRLLSMLSYTELKELAVNETFLQRLEAVWEQFDRYMSEKPGDDEPFVAYFSMEYGLHESLKIYSGGLGILAGDYLKEASDSNKRITGIGLLYRYGYFTQKITPYGDQVAGYIPQKFTDLPIHPLRDPDGDWMMISIAFPGRNVYAKIWEVKVGRVQLFLMDTDIEENGPHDRFITHQLYGGDLENRFKQELLLGVGGIRLIDKLQLQPEVFHCNEGHAAFLGFERIRDLVQKEFLTFEEALEVVRSTTLFTTHTPVPAGHDRFPEELLRAYISHYPERLHITWDDLMALGLENSDLPGAQFSMSVLAIRTSQEVNGVSRIHGEVSRKMFRHLFDGYFAEEVHIGHVTNGVHYQSWTHPEWQRIHAGFLPQPPLHSQHLKEAWQGIQQVSDEILWQTRNRLKSEMLMHLRGRLASEMTLRQEAPGHIVRVLESLEQPILTIGFARRFATYKRAHLLFTNEERLGKLLNNRKRPVRFIFAGKAHPNDKAGQDLIKRIIEISHKPDFAGKVIFVENYDMQLGRFLTQGCDIWMNTPTRPMEASGTSGEKAVMNGVLNLSVLDGWWAEGYVQGAGWALPEARVFENQALQDQLDAETIYNLLEDKITPLFYDRNSEGIPVGWIQSIRKNFMEITPKFTMKRMMMEYHDQYYSKLKERNVFIRTEQFRNAGLLASWKRRVMVHWDNISVEEKALPDSTVAPLNLGDDFNATIDIHAPGLGPDDLGMEVIFGEKVHDVVEKVFFKEVLKVTSLGHGRLRFTCSVPTTKAGVYDYAFRLFPTHPFLAHRMDFPLVKWV